MKLFLYLVLLFSLSTAIVEIHASDENTEIRSNSQAVTDQELQKVEIKIEQRQIIHMLNLLEKSGRLEKSEVLIAKKSIYGLSKDELLNFKFQIRDLID